MTAPVARHFADFACAGTDPPAGVIHQANRAILDTLGVIVAGAAHPTTRAVAAAHLDRNGAATLTIGGQAPAEIAALINGTAAHVWDFDDTSYTGIMHGSAVILPTVLALAAEMRAEADLQRRAFIVGSEITYVLADICTHDHYFKGWWSTVTFGLVGATAAAGVLLGLGRDAMQSAIGLAAAAAGGGKVVFGTDAKPFLVGEAARRAITFARMAGAGLSGPHEAFEDSRGFLALLNGGQSKLSELETLGKRWRLVEPGLLFKTNPVCSAAQAAIEQTHGLLRELNATAGDIETIRAEVPELVYISLVYPDPQTPAEAQFSLPFAVACAALYGKVRFEDLLPGAQQTPEKKELMARVQTEIAEDLSTDEARQAHPESARITLTLRDGRAARGFCGVPRGMPDNPQSDAELISKFDAAITHGGRKGAIETGLGGNPAQTFARIVNRANHNTEEDQ